MTDLPLPDGFRFTESRTAPLPVDSNDTPIIVECPATGCLSLDLQTIECAPGQTWAVTCGAGHLAFIYKKEDQ